MIFGQMHIDLFYHIRFKRLTTPSSSGMIYRNRIGIRKIAVCFLWLSLPVITGFDEVV